MKNVIANTILSLLAVILMITAPTTFAEPSQEPMPIEHRQPVSADEMLVRMTQDLDLTEEQQKQLKPILEQKVEKMKALAEQRKALHEQHKQKIAAILTEQQKQKMTKMRPPKKGKLGCGHDKKH